MARLVAFVFLVAACGGSSSESPWPVEPLDMEGAPIGEREPGTRAPDTAGLENYGQGGSAAEETGLEAAETPPEETPEETGLEEP
jgi:hypothetical protein